MINLNNKKVFNLFVTPNWNTDSSGFTYITQQKNQKQLQLAEVLVALAEVVEIQVALEEQAGRFVEIVLLNLEKLAMVLI